MAISWLSPGAEIHFPPLEHATEHGLLAAGGDLSAARLLAAYQRGIFPWFNKQDPILWWSPNPRMVLIPSELKISKSLNKTLRKGHFKVTFDMAFNDVMQACAAPRNRQSDKPHDTWIHEDMVVAYQTLHQQGYAHSVECWHEERLVGGLYGVAIGKMFYGESMFSFVSDSSKVALIALCQQLQRWQFPLIDCQVHSEHLVRLGAKILPRDDFIAVIRPLCEKNNPPGTWQLDCDLPYAI